MRTSTIHTAVALMLASLLVMPAAAQDNAEVDRLLYGIANAAQRDQARQRLEELGADATPRLAEHVRGKDPNKRVLALACLQFCWSDEARDAVVEAIPQADRQSRQLAFRLLARHESEQSQVELLKPLAESKRPEVAGPALGRLMMLDPDRAHALRAVSDPRLAAHVGGSLTRFYGRDLSPGTRKVIARAKPADRVKLITALIHQHDDSAVARRLMLSNLTRGPADVHDRAAEYLRWHGTAEDVPRIEAAMNRERDPYARASMAEAVRAIGLRAERFKQGGEPTALQAGKTATDSYSAAFDTLKASPDEQTRAAVVAVLAEAEPMEPYFRYGITEVTPELSERIEARLRLQTLASGYPMDGIDMLVGERGATNTDVPLPDGLVAETLMAPVRGYFDGARTSYGLAIGNTGGPFANSNHVGDDVAWEDEHATIVAIGDGVVRQVLIGVRSWGGLVIVEHVDGGGKRFCSLYSHLCPLIAVRTGDVVNKGQKLGSLGRTYTWEGGGYRAHLHFGIHKGGYDNGRWVTGYMDPQRFRAGEHGWVEPRAFIEARQSEPTTTGDRR